MEPRLPMNAGPVQWAGPEDTQCIKSGLIHCIRLPREAAAGPVPALVMLHGWRGDETSMWIFKSVIPGGVAAVTPRAPLELADGEFAWFRHGVSRSRPEPELLEEGLAYLVRFLESLPQLYPIDAGRLLLAGFSQGGAVGNGLAVTRPGKITGMASLASMMPGLPDEQAQAGGVAGLPVFIAHGTRDPIIPLEAARRTRDTYTRLGADVTYGEYNTGHKMTVQGIKDLKAWVAGVIKK